MKTIIAIVVIFFFFSYAFCYLRIVDKKIAQEKYWSKKLEEIVEKLAEINLTDAGYGVEQYDS